MSPRTRVIRSVIAVAVLVVLTACTGTSPAPAPTDDVTCSAQPPVTLSVLAGSELSDVEPLLTDLAACTGVTLKLEKVGTLEGAQRLIKGEAFDLAWFSTASYLNLLASPGSPGRPIATESIMSSPVVFGVREDVADRFGWTESSDLTWADIAAKAKTGQLRYAMTDPTKSNSGFAALLGAATEFAGTGAALRLQDIDEAKLAGFLVGHALPAASSQWLRDAYLRDQDHLDGIVNYESVLLQLNADKDASASSAVDHPRLSQKLRLIYPKDGLILADYPLMMMNPDRRKEYQTVVQWLKTPTIQRRLMHDTARRPANPTVELDPQFPTRVIAGLPLPATFDVFQRLFDVYLRFRRPPHVIYVLDVSGSMQGQPLADLKTALGALAGTDTSDLGKLSQFRPGEQVTVMTFADRIVQERDFTIRDTSPASTDLAELRAFVNDITAGGDTAIYDSVLHAYNRVQTSGTADTITTIVLLTDGLNNTGITGEEFVRAHASIGQPGRSVRTFAIRFGNASTAELQVITDATGGTVFDAGASSLLAAFTEIRGYQ